MFEKLTNWSLTWELFFKSYRIHNERSKRFLSKHLTWNVRNNTSPWKYKGLLHALPTTISSEYEVKALGNKLRYPSRGIRNFSSVEFEGSLDAGWLVLAVYRLIPDRASSHRRILNFISTDLTGRFSSLFFLAFRDHLAILAREKLWDFILPRGK